MLNLSSAVTAQLCTLTHEPWVLWLKVYAETSHKSMLMRFSEAFQAKTEHEYQRAHCKWSFLILDMYQLFTTLFFLGFIV